MRRPQDVQQLTRRSILGMGLAALLLPGCGSKHAKKSAAPVIETASTTAPVSPAPSKTIYSTTPIPNSPPAVQVSPTIKLHGGLSQEEIARLYDGAQVTNVSVVRPAPRAPAPPVVVESVVPPVDPSWDVRLQRAWRHIVIHHSATDTGSAASFHKSHLARGWDGLGYHFVIGNGTGTRDGQVEVGYRWKRQKRGAHAGNLEYNEHGIGICLVGDFQSGHPSRRQLASLRSLVRFLQSKCRIPTSEVIGHCQVPGKDTLCPGAHFNMAAFKRSLSSTTVSTLPVSHHKCSHGVIKYPNPNGAGCP